MKLHERLERENGRLTPRERELASYILKASEQLAFESASSIARQNGTSPATVIRFFAKLGYPSYSDVQDELRGDLSAKLASPAARSEARGSKILSLRDVVAATTATSISNLEQSITNLDLEKFEALVELISSTPGKVYIMGERYSYGAAHILHGHLNLCREGVVLVDTGASMTADRQMWINQDDILLCLSLRRYAKATLTSAEYFSRLGATVVAVTDSLLAPVVRVSKYRILVSSSGTGIFDAHTALVGMMHVIIEAVAARLKDSLKTSLLRADQLWTHHSIFAKE